MNRHGRLSLGIGRCAAITLVMLAAVSQTVASAEVFPPGISIAAIHSPTVTADGPQLMCRVRVDNPNDQSLAVSNANVDLKLAGTPAARGRLPEPVIIPATGVKEVDVVVDVIPGAAMTWMPLFLGDSNFSVPYEVAGIVDVDNADIGRVPFNESGQVEMTRSGIRITPDL
jgi:LEA14-like dessication related protein